MARGQSMMLNQMDRMAAKDQRLINESSNYISDMLFHLIKAN